jgi:hypothetical protein
METPMSTKTTAAAKAPVPENEYRCAIERNQNGKYTVRIQASFGGTRWTLGVYFLASTFNGAMKKLEETLQLLQKDEERLWFWSRERSDDPKLAGDLLEEHGLQLDRRTEFPRKTAGFGVARERAVPAATLAPMRRVLADSIEETRAAAGD